MGACGLAHSKESHAKWGHFSFLFLFFCSFFVKVKREKLTEARLAGTDVNI